MTPAACSIRARRGELRIALRGHVAEELGDIPLGTLRRWQVQAFVNELGGFGLAPRRLRAIVAALRALTRYAREQGLLDEDPTQGVILPTEDGQQPRTFTTTDQLATVQQVGSSPVIPDAALRQLMKVVTVVFILIAVVLAAESI